MRPDPDVVADLAAAVESPLKKRAGADANPAAEAEGVQVKKTGTRSDGQPLAGPVSRCAPDGFTHECADTVSAVCEAPIELVEPVVAKFRAQPTHQRFDTRGARRTLPAVDRRHDARHTRVR